MNVVFKTKGGIRHPPIGAGDRGGDKRHVRRRLLTERERERAALRYTNIAQKTSQAGTAFLQQEVRKSCLKVTVPFTKQALNDLKELKPSEH